MLEEASIVFAVLALPPRVGRENDVRGFHVLIVAKQQALLHGPMVDNDALFIGRPPCELALPVGKRRRRRDDDVPALITRILRQLPRARRR